MPEAAVMLAVAEWLFSRGATEVRAHPDGLHMKDFDMPGWLEGRGFRRVSTTGKRGVSGTFERGSQQITIHSKPGLGDVVATLDGVEVEVETKGGVINSRHPGRLSRLRKGLHEAVGQLMASPRGEGQLIAAVPSHPETLKVAEKLRERCSRVGITLALIERDGRVNVVGPNRQEACASRSA